MTFESNKKNFQAKVHIIVKFENELQPSQKVFWENFQKNLPKRLGKKVEFVTSSL
jgi:hypothetical protein